MNRSEEATAATFEEATLGEVDGQHEEGSSAKWNYGNRN